MIRTDLILLGAGLAHVAVLRRFAIRPEPGLRLTLISREPETPYAAMLPGLIRGEYSFDQAHIDLAPLAAAADARLILAEAIGIDLEQRRLVLAGRPALTYDLLSIDIGGEPVMPAAAGTPVKPIGRFLDRLAALSATLPENGRIAVVGGGAAGTELALALVRRFGRHARIALVCESAEPVATAPAHARRVVRAALVDAGVELISGVRATGLMDGRLTLSDGSAIAVAEALWATGAGGPPFLAASGLACNDTGSAQVDATLQSLSHPGVFVAGDCAALEGDALANAGIWPARAGPLLAGNLRHAARGRPLRRRRPWSDAVAMLGLGDGRAVAWRNGLALSGRPVWRWKDRIDRRGIRVYQQPVRPMAGANMGGGGRDAEAGAAVLAGVLAALPRMSGAGVLIGLGAPDEAAVLMPPPGQAIVQSVKQFRAFIDDPFVFGQVAAVHALSDLHAMGARPWSALAIAAVPSASANRTQAELSAMLLGATGVLRTEGCSLVGGRSVEAGELVLGFAVTGLINPTLMLRKSGLCPGDALLLTKRVGTGIVLAGHRRGEAKAAWLLATIESMRASNGPAATILRAHDATACTHVTGAGLAGDLLAMLRASEVAAVLLPDAVPALPGTRELAARGVESALAPENCRALGAAATDPGAALLVDPQSSGGLLAGVPGDQAEACLAALRAAGVPAAIVGWVRPADGEPTLQLRRITGRDGTSAAP